MPCGNIDGNKIEKRICMCGCKKFFKCNINSNKKYIQGHNPSKTTFKEGHIPWNKGLHKRLNTGKTHFKKNHGFWTGKKRNPLTDEWKKKISESNKGKKHTAESKNKISKGRLGIEPWNKGKVDIYRGDKAPNWQGGKSFEPYSVKWTKTLKKLIRNRDNYTCQHCYKKGKDIHHIDYNKKNCKETNLITLCHKCHSKTNFNRNYWKEYLKELISENR